jgi:Na+/melibiose symporter-like transporter
MRLNYKRTFFIGLAFLSISAFWQVYDNIVPLILKNTFGIGETVAGGIMAIDNVLALFLLPLFGALSDKVDTKLGKRTPFILFGTVCAVIFMMLIPYADQTKSFPLFFVSMGIVLLAMSTYRSPAVALMPDLTPKPLRSEANAVINLMGAVGGIFALAMISLLVPKGDHPDFTKVYLAVAALMVFAVAVLIITIRERKLAAQIAVYDDEPAQLGPEEKKEAMPKEVRRSFILLLTSIFLWFTAYNAVTTAFSRYATTIWNYERGSFANALMVAMAAAIICFIPVGILSSRIGRKKMIVAGIIMMSISYFCGFLFKTYSPWINLVFAFTGIGWSSINVNSYPMVVEMSRGSDIGKYTGMYYTSSMTAQIFTPILSGFFMEYIDYRTLFPYAVIFSLLSLCTMLNVKHGDSKPPHRVSKLEHFDLAD